MVWWSSGFRKHWNDYFWNIHPRTETQFKVQKFLAGANPWYDGWMRGRAEDERIAREREIYGIGWDDIVSPWLASLSGGNAAQSTGQAFSRVSSNIGELYASASYSRKKRKGRRYRYH